MVNILKYGIAAVVLVGVTYTSLNTPKQRTRNNRTVYIAAPLRDTLLPERLTTFAESLTGTKYNYGCSKPETGFDCSGFVSYVFSHFGLIVPPSSVDFTNIGQEVPLPAARRGDLILFTGTNPQVHIVGHLGIVTSNTDTLRFIHSSSGKEYSVTTTPLNEYYRGRFVKVIRVFDDAGEFRL